MKRLYLGTEAKIGFTHFPIIKIVPRKVDLRGDFTHIIITSKNAVHLLSDDLLKERELWVIGPATAKALEERGFHPSLVARESTQEGLIKHLPKLKDARVLYARSSRARPLLANALDGHTIVDLYDTITTEQTPPALGDFEEIIFTSPSTVDAFIELYGSLPKVKCTPIGPITAAALQKIFEEA